MNSSFFQFVFSPDDVMQTKYKYLSHITIWLKSASFLNIKNIHIINLKCLALSNCSNVSKYKDKIYKKQNIKGNHDF